MYSRKSLSSRNLTRVLMIVNNKLTFDNRVRRAAKAVMDMDVSLVVYSRGGDLGFSGAVVISLPPIGNCRCVLKKVLSLMSVLLFNLYGIWVAVRVRPEVVHCHDYDTLFIGLVASKVFGSKLIYDNHECIQDLRYLHRYPMFVRKVLSSLELWSKSQLYVMVVVSEGIRRLYKSLHFENVVVVRNIPDVSRSVLHVSADMEELIKISTEKKLLLYLGANFSYGRGNRLLKELLIALPEQYQLVVFGNYSVAIKEAIAGEYRGKGLDGRLRIFPAIAQERLWSIGRYFTFGVSLIEPVCYSYKYSLPNKLFEYIHMGLPIISTDIPEQRAVIEAYKIGVIVNENNIATSASEIVNFLYVENTVLRAQSELNWRNEVRIINHIYQ